jgi:hypothetical protein
MDSHHELGGRRHGSVEERRHNRKKQISAVHHRYMRRTGEHRELRMRKSDEVSSNTSSEKPKHFDRMFGTNDIGISNNQ